MPKLRSIGEDREKEVERQKESGRENKNSYLEQNLHTEALGQVGCGRYRNLGVEKERREGNRWRDIKRVCERT